MMNARTSAAAAVETVIGPVPLSELGFTLPHEHVVNLEQELTQNYLTHLDEEAIIAQAQAELTRVREAGVDTMIDMTVLGLGRDVARVRQIVEPTGLNVILATGLYMMGDLPLYFHRHGPASVHGGPDPIEKFIVRDITEGIGGTDMKAAVIKCAIGPRGMTPDVERITRACAAAQRVTGAPISTHSDVRNESGRDQLRVLLEEGIPAGKILIGHCGDSTDLGYLTELLDHGCYIGMDRFGMDNLLPTKDRCDVVTELVSRGYAAQLMLSHDTNVFTINWDDEVRERVIPDWHHDFIPVKVVPQLLERGVSQDDIDQMTRRNTVAFFS